MCVQAPGKTFRGGREEDGGRRCRRGRPSWANERTRLINRKIMCCLGVSARSAALRHAQAASPITGAAQKGGRTERERASRCHCTLVCLRWLISITAGEETASDLLGAGGGGGGGANRLDAPGAISARWGTGSCALGALSAAAAAAAASAIAACCLGGGRGS